MTEAGQATRAHVPAQLAGFPERGECLASSPALNASDNAPLPLEIGFLAVQGWPIASLRQAAGIAKAIGAPADEVMIKHGLIGEEAFYRALAGELRAPYIREPVVSRHADFPNSILSGLAPLGDGTGRMLRAPRGEDVVRLLASRRAFGGALAITTPSALSEAVFRARAAGIAHRAANELPDRTALLSYRGQITALQIVVAALVAAAFAAAATRSWETTKIVLALGLAPVFLGMVILRLAAAIETVLHPPAPPLPRLPDAALPVYTVIVAVHREGRVMGQLVEALCGLDYPPSKLDIKLVLETGDRDTADVLARLDLPPHIQILTAPPGQPRTKPRALNVALPLARGTFTVVYDADDRPDPGQLRLAAATFAHMPRQVACLQARLAIDNADQNLITRLFALEYMALFEVINPGLLGMGHPIPLGGTSNHFRTGVLQEACGWDAWNVTEDADLGVRLARAGYAIADLPSLTLEEAPGTMKGWLRQRTRWIKGFMQTCLTHTRQPLVVIGQLGIPGAFALATSIFGTVLSGFGYPFFVALMALDLVEGRMLSPDGALGIVLSTLSIVLFGTGVAAIVVPALAALWQRHDWRLLACVPLLPLYYGLLSLAAWRGLAELVLDPFGWNKTEHGLAPRPPVRGGAITAAPSGPSRQPREHG